MWQYILHPNNPREERDVGLFELTWRTFATLIKFPIHRLFHPDYPYLAPDAVNYLINEIKTREDEISVFEYGMGKSSLWWAKKVDRYVAVEHSKRWFTKIHSKLKKEDLLHKVDLIYSPPVNDDYNWKEEWEYYDEINRKPGKPQFRKYIASIDDFEDKSFDIICIDGRERIGATIHSLSKIKDDGIMIFDDSNRPRYKEALFLLDNWNSYEFDFGLQKTTIFHHD